MARRDDGPRKAAILALGAWVLALVAGVVGRLLHGRPRVDPEDVRAGHELGDLSMGAVAFFFGGLGVVLLLAFVGTSVWYGGATGRPFWLRPPVQGLDDAPTGPTPPAPQLETASGQVRAQVRAAEDQRLQTYGWVDRERGVVRIPIDRAIDLVAQRGLPARAAADAERFQDHAETSPSGASSGRVPEATWP